MSLLARGEPSRSSEVGVKQPSLASASTTGSTGTPRCSAIWVGRGEAPSSKARSASAVLIRAWSSWILRVGRIIQPWSRKYLRSSPRIVGAAYDMKSLPVLMS